MRGNIGIQYWLCLLLSLLVNRHIPQREHEGYMQALFFPLENGG
jgi:hypothetical protein